MIIIGLIFLLTILLGDNDLPFLLPREEKSINRVIEDKEKHKLLDFIVKGVENKEKQYWKDKKGYIKELEQLNLDRHSTAEQFSEVANNIYITNNEAFRYMIKIRLSIAQVITTTEWNLILEDSRDRFKKNVIKYEKIYPEFEKTMEKIIKRVENVMSDKDDAVIIDVGITRVADDSEKGYYLTGDVDFENVSKKASFITPVPGGVGPMTIAMLLKNTLLAREQHRKRN